MIIIRCLEIGLLNATFRSLREVKVKYHDAIISKITYNTIMRQKTIILSSIILALVLIAVGIGFLIGWQKNQSVEVAGVNTQSSLLSTQNATNEAILSINQSTISGQISEAEQLVNSFYRWYINCLKENGTCDYQNRPDLDYQKLTEKTRDVSGYDRLLCAQDLPDFFRIDHFTTDHKGIDSVFVVESFGNEQVQFIAEVEKTASGPKIINIICPRP